jgi:hypothetical protein
MLTCSSLQDSRLNRKRWLEVSVLDGRRGSSLPAGLIGFRAAFAAAKFFDLAGGDVGGLFLFAAALHFGVFQLLEALLVDLVLRMEHDLTSRG